MKAEGYQRMLGNAVPPGVNVTVQRGTFPSFSMNLIVSKMRHFTSSMILSAFVTDLPVTEVISE